MSRIKILLVDDEPDFLETMASIIKGTEKLGVSAFIPKLSTFSDVSASLKATFAMSRKKLGKERIA